MSLADLASDSAADNPIDLVEQIVSANESRTEQHTHPLPSSTTRAAPAPATTCASTLIAATSLTIAAHFRPSACPSR